MIGIPKCIQWSRSQKLRVMIVLTGSYMVMELVVGYSTHCAAIIADSFHMISDVLSLTIALFAIYFSNKDSVSEDYSYGLARSELVGALINSVFLLALCFTIIVEAIARFFDTKTIEHPVLLIYTGCMGLLVNVIGMIIFHDHHHHGDESKDDTAGGLEGGGGCGGGGKVSTTGCSDTLLHHHHPTPLEGVFFVSTCPHSEEQQCLYKVCDHHNPSSPEKKKKKKSFGSIDIQGETAAPSPVTVKVLDSTDTGGGGHHHHHGDHHHSHGSWNMKAVFLHILGDALGSLAAISVAVVRLLFPDAATFVGVLDPLMALVIAGILITMTTPVLRRTIKVMLQATPPLVNVNLLREALAQITGVSRILKLHIWELSESKFVGSVTVLCAPNANVSLPEILAKVHDVFQANSVEVTIQPKVFEGLICDISSPSPNSVPSPSPSSTRTSPSNAQLVCCCKGHLCPEEQLKKGRILPSAVNATSSTATVAATATAAASEVHDEQLLHTKLLGS